MQVQMQGEMTTWMNTVLKGGSHVPTSWEIMLRGGICYDGGEAITQEAFPSMVHTSQWKF